MKKAARILLTVTGLLFAFLIYVQLTYKQTFTAPTTGLKASSDSAIIARGKYLAMGPAHCWTCHVQNPTTVDLQKGIPDMSGGMELHIPMMATLYTPNITPDKKTGIGRYTDEQLSQAIKYNLTPKGHALIPFMSYNTMSDEDIVAIMSYLRATKPIERNVPEHDVKMLGKLMLRFVFKPVIAQENQKFLVTRPDTTAEYGKYLAYSVTNCNGCHTQRSPTGDFSDKAFAGGHKKEMQNGTFVTPNLTPDPGTGRIYNWSQQAFINRFRMKRTYPDDFMPWEAFGQMSDNDLKAIYNFLHTLEPVQNKVESTYIPLAQQ
jgi:mono/diheme cytochrome c family protein